MKQLLTICLTTCVCYVAHSQAEQPSDILHWSKESLKQFFADPAWGKPILLGKTKNDSAIYAYYYNRGGTDSAMVMAGVHGSEFLGVDVANSVKVWLDRKKDSVKQFRWKVLVLPSLFVDNVKEATSKRFEANYYRCTKPICYQSNAGVGSVDPNRQMPKAGELLILTNNGKAVKSAIGTDIEKENQYLIWLVQVFDPSRIVSVHCKNEWDKQEIGIYADPRTSEKQVPLGYGPDAALAIEMAFKVDDSGGIINGNFPSKILKKVKNDTFYTANYYNGIYPKDSLAARKSSRIKQYRSFQDFEKSANGINPKGVSFGTWAATEIRNQVGALLKQAANMITIEMPQYYSFYPNGRISATGDSARIKNVNAYKAAITEVFLSDK